MPVSFVQAQNASFGGPASAAHNIQLQRIGGQIAYRFNPVDRIFKPWFELQKKLQESIGLELSMDYSVVYQAVTNSANEPQAASGIYRFYGEWPLSRINDSSTIIFRIENRHRIHTPIAPSEFGRRFGAETDTACTFNDINWALTNLYFQLKFANGNGVFLIGQLDTYDYVDLYSMADPQKTFLNFAFHNGPSMFDPEQGIGAALHYFVIDNFYVMGGINDANGDPTNPNLDVFSDFETFKFVELGWVPTRDDDRYDGVNFTVWQVDQRKCENAPRDYGVLASISWVFDDVWLPFLRVGWSKDQVADYNRSLSAGLGRVWHNKDLVGFGFNWNSPSEQDSNSQLIFELYYRLQVSRYFALTADLQYIDRPSLNKDTPNNVVFGLRGRIAI